MNNSQLAMESVKLSIEEPRDNTSQLRKREEKLITVIASLQEIGQNKAWSTLKTELFDNLTETLKSQLLTESRKENPDANKLNRLSGELKWAERYADLFKLEQEFKNELTNIKLTLHGTT